ncbi:hypothetical protein L6R50_21935 [Myxococcota bacterium]|nr:hypothetical protein [Myxococcota bacterium]
MDRETSTGTPALGLTREGGPDPEEVVPMPVFAGKPGARAVVPVSFSPAGRLHDCLVDPRRHAVEQGDRVVVEGPRGAALGTVKGSPREARGGGGERDMRRVVRIARPEDVEAEEEGALRNGEVLRIALRRVRQKRLRMKLIKAEYHAIGARVNLYFAAEQRVDFRELVQELGRELRARVDMRQIGVRDEAKVLGGIGHCGRELCCSTWLRESVPVSIRMAKDQNLALTPAKVSGLCGRLMCCLSYEHETYRDMRRSLPKAGKTVETRFGPGRVVHVEVLTQKFTVQIENGRRTVCSLEDWIRPPSSGAPEDAEPESDADDDSGLGDGETIPSELEPEPALAPDGGDADDA